MAKTFAFVREVFSEYSSDDCPRMAAALSYYTVFSLAPLLIVLISIGGLVFEPSDVEGRVREQIAGIIGPDGAEQVQQMLRSASKEGTAGVAGLISGLGLLVGASGVMLQLQAALNEAWDVRPDPALGGIRNFFTKRLLSFGMVLGLGFLMIVSLLLSAALSALDQRVITLMPEGLGETAAHFIDLGIALVVLTASFAVIFRYVPDAQVRWSDVGPGALVTAALFVGGKFALGMYLGSRNLEGTFGAAGSLALILVWVYYSGSILLLGAEFTQVWAQRRGASAPPELGAKRVA
ncbi:MAG: YihY/virulence factor BrkB family protein [Planctomycetales bacterium]|nr:YihY/virulence factor BrkB family protein [Planctomycetales bacterium]